MPTAPPISRKRHRRKGVKYKSIHTARRCRPAAGHQRARHQDDSEAKAKADQGSDARSAQLKRFCAQLQSNIALLQSNQSLQRMGSDGKTTPVDDKVRAQQLKQQQMRYNAYCNGK